MPSVRLTETDSGRLVALQIGDELVVALAENPTTGFTWSLVTDAPGPLQLLDSAFAPAGAANPGGGGRRVFRFHAAAAGNTQVRAKHWREWEGESSVTLRFSLAVTVVEH